MSWCCAIWFKRASSRPICTFFFSLDDQRRIRRMRRMRRMGVQSVAHFGQHFSLDFNSKCRGTEASSGQPPGRQHTHTHRATHTQTYTHSHTHKRWARRRRRSIPSTTASLQWTDQRCHLTSHCVCVCVWVCKEWSSVSHTHTTSTRSAQSNFYFSQSTKCGDDFSHFLALWSLGGTNNSAGWKLFGGSTKRRNDEIGIGKNFGFFFPDFYFVRHRMRERSCLDWRTGNDWLDEENVGAGVARRPILRQRWWSHSGRVKAERNRERLT